MILVQKSLQFRCDHSKISNISLCLSKKILLLSVRLLERKLSKQTKLKSASINGLACFSAGFMV